MKINKSSDDFRAVHRSLNQSLDVSIQVDDHEEIEENVIEGSVMANIMVPEKNEMQVPLPSTGTKIEKVKPKYVSVKRRPGFQ